MNSPFTHINTATIRAERRDAFVIAGHVICLGILTCAITGLASVALSTLLMAPDLAAEAVARARW